jgi:uncharacterized protein YneF (UPF0154 family)
MLSGQFWVGFLLGAGMILGSFIVVSLMSRAYAKNLR